MHRAEGLRSVGISRMGWAAVAILAFAMAGIVALAGTFLKVEELSSSQTQAP